MVMLFYVEDREAGQSLYEDGLLILKENLL